MILIPKDFWCGNDIATNIEEYKLMGYLYPINLYSSILVAISFLKCKHEYKLEYKYKYECKMEYKYKHEYKLEYKYKHEYKLGYKYI